MILRNRAIEFLHQADSILYPGLRFDTGQARIYIQAAVDEVQELLDIIAALTNARQAQPDGRGVLVAEARPIPALLQERPRADLRALSESTLTGGETV